MSQQRAGHSACALIIVPKPAGRAPFADKETEVQSRAVTCPKDHARKRQGLQDGPKDSGSPSSFHLSRPSAKSVAAPHPRMGQAPWPWCPITEVTLWCPHVAAEMPPWLQSSKLGPQRLSTDPGPFPQTLYGLWRRKRHPPQPLRHPHCPCSNLSHHHLSSQSPLLCA